MRLLLGDENTTEDGDKDDGDDNWEGSVVDFGRSPMLYAPTIQKQIHFFLRAALALATAPLSSVTLRR
jgi:hypothetical protein